jgi:REP element-mobilizing transposase RayT
VIRKLNRGIMPRRKGSFVVGGYYHVFNRGIAGEMLFHSRDNYLHCLALLKRYIHEYGVSVIAYTLMPTHYHLLLKQLSTIPISRFISVLFNSYVQAFNLQHGRRGPLFEGRFKHVHIDNEEYLVHLCRYIHLNPVKAGLVKRLEDWPFSNYLDWIGIREGELIDPEFMGSYFRTASGYREFVIDYQDDPEIEEKITRYLLD